MANQTKISWTNVTWNPVTGCTKCSDGCLIGYCLNNHKRMQNNPKFEKYRAGFDTVAIHLKSLNEPAEIKKPSRIFVCSISDLFHENVPEDFIQMVFKVMNDLPRHQFQILTKRSERLAEIAPRLTWTENIWAGITVESEKYLYRIDHLRQVPASIRWLSAEPLLSGLPGLDLTGINWVVAGGETGVGCRPMDPEWVRGLRDQCRAANVAFFFKQWGGRKRGKGGNILDGIQHQEYPI